MKFRYILTAIVATLVAAIGCTKVELDHLEQVQVSKSYISLPVEGGSAEITVKAVADWTIDEIPEWLTVEPAKGAAGEATVKFSAKETKATNEAILKLNCAGATQLLTVLQMAEKVELPITSAKDVNAGEDGKLYRVKGTVTKIENTKYGNMYIEDETGSVYVYGTLYEGAEKEFSKHGIEVGDIVTVEGPRDTYKGSPQLKNVTVIAIEKSLIKVESVEPEDAILPIEGGDFNVTLTVKGDGVKAEVPAEAKSWLSVSNVVISGTTAVVTYTATANNGGDRSVELTIATEKDGKTYTALTSLTQKGAIVEANVDEFLAAPKGDTQYRVTGIIRSIDVNTQYNNATIVIAGGTGKTVELFRAVKADGKIADLKLQKNDKVTFVGKRDEYNGKAQMAKGGVYESHERFVAKTVAEFLKAAEDDTMYLIEGEIVSFKKDKYDSYSLTIKDKTGEVYSHRTQTFDKTKATDLVIENGGTIILAGKRGSYNGKAQMVKGFIVDYAAPVVVDPSVESIKIVDFFASATQNVNLEAGKSYKWGSLTCVYTQKGKNTSQYNKNDSGIRFYTDDILEVSAEKTIEKLEFVTPGDKKGPVTADSGKVETVGENVVWTGSAKKVVLTASAQMRFKEIIVTYAK